MLHQLRVTVCAVGLLTFAIGCGQSEAPTPATPAPTVAPAEPAPPAANLPLTGNGAVQGSVTAPVPELPSPIRLSSDNYCQKAHAAPVYSQAYAINRQGRVQWAFAYVKSGLEGREYPAPEGVGVLDQQGCMYQPHMLGLRVGQIFEIHNSDRTLHNVHAVPKVKPNKPFNIAHPATGTIVHKKSFPTREIMVRIKCDVHPWMSAYIGVLDHPFFAVTGEDGTFTISGLPAGEYTIGVWHERLGELEQAVTVADDGTVTADFVYTEE